MSIYIMLNITFSFIYYRGILRDVGKVNNLDVWRYFYFEEKSLNRTLGWDDPSDFLLLLLWSLGYKSIVLYLSI